MSKDRPKITVAGLDVCLGKFWHDIEGMPEIEAASDKDPTQVVDLGAFLAALKEDARLKGERQGLKEKRNAKVDDDGNLEVQIKKLQLLKLQSDTELVESRNRNLQAMLKRMAADFLPLKAVEALMAKEMQAVHSSISGIEPLLTGRLQAVIPMKDRPRVRLVIRECLSVTLDRLKFRDVGMPLLEAEPAKPVARRRKLRKDDV